MFDHFGRSSAGELLRELPRCRAFAMMFNVPLPLTPVLPDVSSSQDIESMWEVLLHNDDHNEMEYVLMSLMKVFSHPAQLACKIMVEAHQRGSAVAEVEGRSEAEKHCEQLRALGLSSTIRKI
jgi:ATP-dependent Clp protease adaptor protein ClpS